MFIPIWIILLIPISLGIIIFKRQPLNPSSPYVFKYPKSLVVFLGFGAIFFTVASILLCLTHTENLQDFVFLFPVFLFFTIVESFGFLLNLNSQLVLEEEYILHRNCWGRVKKFKYEEISEIKTSKNSNTTDAYKICIGNKKLEVNHYMTNFNKFPQFMENRINAIQNNIKFTDIVVDK